MEPATIQPMISVCVLTYNHEAYIAETIEGIVKQQHDYLWEFIIADDKSKDKTQEIILSYKEKYPFIKVIFQNPNVGASQNFIDLFTAATGKYIAICEGDDYWTDPLKLKKQVDFLEANPEYAMCFHAVNILEEGKELFISPLNLSRKEETFTIEDLAKKNLAHTPSVMYRNVLNARLPGWFIESPLGDYALHMLHAKHGKISYLPDVMAVYRRHTGGVFSTLKERDILLKSHKVMQLLLTENLAAGVTENLKLQRRKYINDVLELSLSNNWNEELFRKDLVLLMDDDELMKEWVSRRLPQEIVNLRNSNSFKLGQKISRLYQLLRFKRGNSK